MLQLHAAPDDEPGWQTTFETSPSSWNRAVVLEHADRVLVVAYGSTGTGTMAYGFDRRDGMLRYTSSPGNIVSILALFDESFRKQIQVVVDDAGRAVIYGHELSGDYIGVLDLASGRLVANERWER